MRNFFKPLRRKIGVVTLMVACVFMVGWVRSFRIREHVSLGSTEGHVHLIGSYDGKFGFINRGGDPPPGIYGVSRSLFKESVKDVTTEWEWSLFGLRILHGKVREIGIPIDIMIVPYWLVVIPLTLLSAWLLLSKPRQSKPIPPAEPISHTTL